MEWKQVKLHYDLNNFSELGSPFNPKVPTTLDKNQKKYKKELEDYIKIFEGQEIKRILQVENFDGRPMANGGISDFLNHDGTIMELNFKGFNGSPKTYKFLGMDVTDDLDCVIKGSHGCIYVGKLFNPKAFSITGLKVQDALDQTQLESLTALITPEAIKNSIETLKFKDLINLEQSINESQFKYMHKSVDSFTFLDNIVNDVSGIKNGFASVILNFINSQVASLTEVSKNNMETLIYGTFSQYWEKLLERYNDISLLLSTLDKFYDFTAKMYGVDKAIELSKNSTEDYEVVGLFTGISKGELNPNALNCEMGQSLVQSINKLYTSKETTFDFEANYYQTTMFEYPVDADITSLDIKTAGALSILDGLKFIDNDLELDPALYDINDEDQRDFFLKNTVTTYKKRFSNFFYDHETDLEDEVIDNILPQDNGIDILNVKGALDSDNQNFDKDVATVSFNKTQILKACRLIKKVTSMVEKNFNEVTK